MYLGVKSSHSVLTLCMSLVIELCITEFLKIKLYYVAYVVHCLQLSCKYVLVIF